VIVFGVEARLRRTARSNELSLFFVFLFLLARQQSVSALYSPSSIRRTRRVKVDPLKNFCLEGAVVCIRLPFASDLTLRAESLILTACITVDPWQQQDDVFTHFVVTHIPATVPALEIKVNLC